MTGKRLGYIRVSTTDQNPERQLEGIPLDKRFTEYATGKNINRPQLSALQDYARDDDLVIVHSMDRLARNVKDLRNLIDGFIARGVKVEFVKEKLTFTGKESPVANLMLMVMGSIAEFEHALIRERMLEGVALAKKAGKYKGRKPKIKLDQERIALIRAEMLTRKTKTLIAKEMGISRYTLYNILKEINAKKHTS
jgi:DNA invertase Pin-like site-specific DNA recombinase